MKKLLKTIKERWVKETPRIWKEIKIISTYLFALFGAIYVGYDELPQDIKIILPEVCIKVIAIFGLISRTYAGLQIKK